MASESDEIRKLLKRLYLLRVTLYLSFVVALGTTTLIVAPSFFQFSGYGPLVPGPVAQTTFANATAATTTTLFSTTKGESARFTVRARRPRSRRSTQSRVSSTITKSNYM